MAVIIKAEKEINAGIRGYRILKIKALKFDELPDEYLSGYPRIWSENDSILCMEVSSNKAAALRKDTFYPLWKIAEYSAIIAEASRRLRSIKKQSEWQGTVVFIDGEAFL